uniref:Uncharacterized protein n=1 Tax=Cyanothece sp. (strain PCC 7425 / ATCC 29141) TaxID=395961 RepID=B8HS42_CYAP4
MPNLKVYLEDIRNERYSYCFGEITSFCVRLTVCQTVRLTIAELGDQEAI